MTRRPRPPLTERQLFHGYGVPYGADAYPVPCQHCAQDATHALYHPAEPPTNEEEVHWTPRPSTPRP